MKSTLLTLKEDFWTIFKSVLSDEHVPPFLFPVSTFKRLENKMSSLQNKIDKLDSYRQTYASISKLENIIDSDYEIAKKFNEVNEELTDVLNEIVKLQNVLSQRTTGLSHMNFMELSKASQLEYGAFLKNYSAVDALSFELVRRILGSNWISNERYIPISLFDSNGYGINRDSLIISIPYYDVFRSRFWPAIAHEVAHIFAIKHFMGSSEIGKLMVEEIGTLMEALNYDQNKAFFQINELTSDIIATCVCPADFFKAATTFPFSGDFFRRNSEYIHMPGILPILSRAMSHPPMDVRLVVMKQIVEKLGIVDKDKDLKDFINFVDMFLERKNLHLSNSSYTFLRRYRDLACEFANSIWAPLKNNLDYFKEYEWDSVENALLNPDKNVLSPIQLLNLGWLKRIKVAKENRNLNFIDYFEVCRSESQLFEYIVNLMYKYYEGEIAAKVEVRDAYDICINIS